MEDSTLNKPSPSEQLRFAVIAIEETAKKYAIPPSQLVKRLNKQGLIEGRLWKYYDLLHTQSREYVADDLMEALKCRENKASAQQTDYKTE